MFFFPEQMLETAESIGETLLSVQLPATLFIATLMPAICEEALHRGFIQYSLRGVKNKWLRILAVGIIFGIFHLDPIRFLPTAILGAILGYLMIETENIIIPALLHLLNNTVSVLTTALSSLLTDALPQDIEISGAELTTSTYLLVIGVYLVISAAIPWMFILGTRLLHTKEYNDEKKFTRKKIPVISIVISSLAFVLGAAAFITGLVLEVSSMGLYNF
jgi:membrane protease YdiL (CAAX protease family)